VAGLLACQISAYTRSLNGVRTIADLDVSERICELHFAEAIQYQSLERKTGETNFKVDASEARQNCLKRLYLHLFFS
jgi:hypothetical protein